MSVHGQPPTHGHYRRMNVSGSTNQPLVESRIVNESRPMNEEIVTKEDAVHPRTTETLTREQKSRGETLTPVVETVMHKAQPGLEGLSMCRPDIESRENSWC